MARERKMSYLFKSIGSERKMVLTVIVRVFI